MDEELRTKLTDLGFDIKEDLRNGKVVELVSGPTIKGMRMHVVERKWNLIFEDGTIIILPEGVEMGALTGAFVVKGGVGIIL